MPMNATTAKACQASHLGVTRTRHRGRPPTLDMPRAYRRPAVAAACPPGRISRPSVIIVVMSLLGFLVGRPGLAGRLPSGPVVLPSHLSWPGMREFDVSDDPARRSMYGIVLTQGRRNDVARLLNARLLREDWPVLRATLDPRLRRWCERRFALARGDDPGAAAG